MEGVTFYVKYLGRWAGCGMVWWLQKMVSFTPLCIVTFAARWWCGPVGRRLLQMPSGPSSPWSYHSPFPPCLLFLSFPLPFPCSRVPPSTSLSIPPPFPSGDQYTTWKCSFGLFDLHHIWAKLIPPDRRQSNSTGAKSFLCPFPSSFIFLLFLLFSLTFVHRRRS